MRPGIFLSNLLFITLWLWFTATVSAQNISTDKVTVGLKNESLETAIKKIEQQSVFRFFYRDEEVRQLGLLNLQQGTRTIEQTLAALLQNTALCFRQMDGNILIEDKNQQYAGEIKGKVINSSDKKPLASASVFLNNALIGTTTANDGSFTLHHVKSGQYELIVSIIGFDTYRRKITIDNNDMGLPVIEINPKTIVLNEIKVKPVNDPERNRYYEWFKTEFLGTSKLAAECRILNPEVLDFSYDKKRGVLTASAAGFLEIENNALGYKIKYLLTDFIKDSTGADLKRIRFRGSAFFKEMKGTPIQAKRWQKRRQEVYEGSMMHFLRSGLNNSFEAEGFRVLRVADVPNPERPADYLITSKINSYKALKNKGEKYRDTLAYWQLKSSLPKTLPQLDQSPLKQTDFIKLTDQRGLYALTGNKGALYIIYNKNHHFAAINKLNDLDDADNKQKTMVSFNAPYTLFDKNGGVTDPSGIAFKGAWGQNRLASFLPVDYDEYKNIALSNGKNTTETEEEKNTLPDTKLLKDGLLSLKKVSDSINETHAPEKLYMQFDKPYYALGDTIWFKTYLFKASYLTATEKSNLLYIDIVNDSNKIVKQYRCAALNGQSWGNITLDEKDFAAGTYMLRAYTNWMRNFGSDYFFTKQFYITDANENNWLINKQVNTTIAPGNKTADVKLQFTNLNKIPLANTPLQLQVMAGEKHLYKQTFQTDKNGLLDVNFKLPEKPANLVFVAESRQNDKKASIPIILNRAENTDVQFLPEGGSLIAGFTARIGFKAVGEDGKSVPISGIVTDHGYIQTCTFQALHNGMGSFDLDIKDKENYAASVTLPGGLIKECPLPPVKSSGTVLQVINNGESDSLAVQIGATKDLALPGNSYYLIGKARGIICYAAIVNFTANNFITRKIAKSLFPTGVTHFTLMNTKYQPLNERLVFIDHQDNLNIQYTTNKPFYGPKDSVSLKIKVTNKDGSPVSGNFSLAVTDDSQVKKDTLNDDNILSHLLLDADLKGYIENPGYYFLSKNKVAAQALDNLLLTQGWVGYNWQQVFNPPAMVYQPEKEFTVNGSVYNVFNKPVKATHVLLFSKSPALLMDTMTDKTGRFVFNHFPKVDTPIFILKAVNKNGKSFNVGIRADEVNPPEFVKPAGPLALPWYVNSDTALLNYTKNNYAARLQENFPTGGHILKEVKISAKKFVNSSQNLNGPGNADIVLDEKDLEAAGKKTLLQLLQENIKGFSENVFRQGGKPGFEDTFLMKYVTDLNNTLQWYFVNRKPVKLIVDGVSVAGVISTPTDPNTFTGVSTCFADMRNYLIGHSAEDVKGIEIMHNTKYTQSYFSRFVPGDLEVEALKNNVNMGPGDIAFVEITTRGGHGPLIDNTPGMYLYKPLPISWPRQFYKPKYTVKDTAKHLPDMRSTINWEPNITTNRNGEATVSFYSADKPSTYTIIMEGSDMNGNLGFKAGKINDGKLKESTK